MSVTVLAPTPALPPMRRASMWEKMFGNFKMGKLEDDDEDSLPLTSPIYQKARLDSVSTGVESTIVYKRTGSVAAGKDIRSCSAPIASSGNTTTKSRPASLSARRSSRSVSRSRRRSSWWRSANPETDADVPAMPAIDRKFSSVFGSHNPDEPESISPAPSPAVSRRASYVPRNAASSFLRTTTPLSSDEKAEVIRRASVGHALSGKPPRPISMKPVPLKLKLSNDNLVQYHTKSAPQTDSNGLLSPSVLAPGISPSISPRGGIFALSSPRSPADTIMEVDSDEYQVDSAKASPSLSPVKTTANVSVVELIV